MAIGIEIALDPSQAVRGADQVDKALDGIADSAGKAQGGVNNLNTAMVDALNKQKRAAEQMIATAQATKAIAQEQSRLIASQASLNSSTEAAQQRQKRYQELSTQIKQAVEQEAKAKQDLVAINNTLARQPQPPAPKNLNATSSALDNIVAAGKAFIGLQVVQQLGAWGKAFIDVADDMKLLQARLEVYTSSQAEAGRVLEQLVESSNRTGVAVKDAAQSFTQFKPAAEALGLTSDQTVKLVTNLQNMARVSGASSQAASAAIYQLSQSFSKGKLNGDELVSVSENLPIVLEQLAKKLGVTRGELTQMAQAQQLTSDKLALLSGDFEDVNAKIEKLPRTTEQAGQALTNNIGLAIAAIDQQIGASKYFAKFLDLLSGGAKGVADLVTSAAQFDKIAAAGEKLNNITAQREKTTKEIADLEAQIRQGYSTKSFGGYTQFVNGTAEAQKKLTALRELDVKLAKDQADAQKNLTSVTPLTDKAVGNLTSQISQIQADLNKAKNTGRADPESAKAIKNLQDQLTYTKALAAGNYELAASTKLGTAATKDQVAEYAAALKAQTEYSNGLKQSKKDASAAAAELKRQEKEQERLRLHNEKYLKTLQDKTTAGQFDVQRAKEQVAQAMLQGQSVEDLSASYLKSIQVQNQLTLQSKQAEAQSRLNADATDAQRQAVDAYVASLYKQEQAKQLAAQVTQVQTDTTNELNPVLGQIEQTKEQEAQRLAVLEEARQLDLVNEQQYQDMKTQIQESGEQQRNRIMTQNAAMLLGATGDLFGGIADVLKQSQGEQSSIYKAMFATSKAFAIAQAGILLWQNVAEASKVGFPWNIPLIAGALAQGVSILGNLQSVAAVGFATGGYVSGAGTGTSDSIPARLSNGEYVMPAKQTRQYRNELAAMRAGSYSGSGGSQMNVEVANYGNDNVQVQQMDDDRVRLIIGEEVPRINASEFNNPYSQTNKAYRSNYNAERKV